MRGQGNCGNVTAGASWSGDVYVLGDLPPPDPKSLTFRAYGGAEPLVEGCSDYWLVLASWFHTALDLFDRGLPYEAAQALHAKVYFTADPVKYGNAMVGLYAEAQRAVFAEPEEYPVLTKEQLGRLDAALATSETLQLDVIHEEGFRNR